MAGGIYFQDGKVSIDESVVIELFGLMRENTAAIASVDKKVTELCATVKEREKGCDNHNKKTDDHEKRIHAIEIWQAGQAGIGAFMWKFGPFVVAIISLGVAIYKK